MSDQTLDTVFAAAVTRQAERERQLTHPDATRRPLAKPDMIAEFRATFEAHFGPEVAAHCLFGLLPLNMRVGAVFTYRKTQCRIYLAQPLVGSMWVFEHEDGQYKVKVTEDREVLRDQLLLKLHAILTTPPADIPF
jgi:hypothetical protein